MTEREAKIRAAVARLVAPDSGVSPEYSLLSIDDTRFLLEVVDLERAKVRSMTEHAAQLLNMFKP